TNKSAAEINNQKLQKINSKTHVFPAEISGNFDLKNAPTESDLALKIGAQVMFLNNHPGGFWVNGTVGKVVDILPEEIIVETQEGDILRVEQHTWIIYKYFLDTLTNTLDQESVGSFKQHPLKLAWAVTIHKSQGKTFNKVIVDFHWGTFAHGQAYVALSRCSSFQGLVFKRPLRKGHVIMDYKVVRFLTQFQYSISDKNCPLEEKVAIIKNAIDHQKTLEIIYLKANDQKSSRTISPAFVGEMEYKGITYMGLKAFCQARNEPRTFRVDRILEIS
ncbi:WYL domain-containing protein, partial [Candidatus Margulisiibacteriota bacterium]